MHHTAVKTIKKMNNGLDINLDLNRKRNVCVNASI